MNLKTIISYKPRCRITGIQRGRNVQGKGTKEPGGEQARGRTGKGAKKPDTGFEFVGLYLVQSISCNCF